MVQRAKMAVSSKPFTVSCSLCFRRSVRHGKQWDRDPSGTRFLLHFGHPVQITTYDTEHSPAARGNVRDLGTHPRDVLVLYSIV